jgi:hypothetical protein
MSDPLFAAFAAVKKPYRGKSLLEWLGKWVSMTTKDLEKVNQSFLKTITTWVVRTFAQRRKGGVPMGYLPKFAWPETQKLNFAEALAAQIILTLRKRGLLEADTQPTRQFQRLVDAFDRCTRI